jgi:hypothetical protein
MDVVIDRPLSLSAASETAAVGIQLTSDKTLLNQGQVFQLKQDERATYTAIGVLGSTDELLKPRLVQRAALSSPSTGQFHLRFIHALAGNPIDLDIHVNGHVVSGLGFGESSPTLALTPTDQHSLIVVPAGEQPNGQNEIMNLEHSLFSADFRYDAALTHEPMERTNGDINGRAWLHVIKLASGQ